MVSRIVSVSSVDIPQDSALRRGSRRPPELRQPGYEEQYDDTVILYDVFRCSDKIWLSGPPLMGFRDLLEASTFTADGDPVAEVHLQDWDRTQRSWLCSDAEQELTITNDVFTRTLPIGSDDASLFQGRNTLMAMSQNNKLVWMQDWLKFYHEVHGVDAVLLYDNASTSYPLEELRDALTSVPGIDVAVVVDWPFAFGPGPGKPPRFDSAWCQHSAFEHAHWRFLRNAQGVINADIDELVITDDGRSVFEHAAESPTGLVRYNGLWVEMAVDAPTDGQVHRYRDFHYIRRGAKPATAKWTLIPSLLPAGSQWRLHSVAKVQAEQTDRIQHRHFKGINTMWRYDRVAWAGSRGDALESVDPDVHVRDERLVELMQRVFPEQKAPVQGAWSRVRGRFRQHAGH